MSNPKDTTTFTFLVIAGLVLILLLGVFKLVRRGPDYRGDKNPYEYDIEQYKLVDPARIGYEEARSIPISFKKLHGIAVDSRDNIYVTGDSALVIVTPTGTILRSLTLSTPAKNLAVAASGTIFLGMTDRVGMLSPGGTEVSLWPPLSENGMITSIAASGEQVFVADAATKTVFRFDFTGKLLGKIDNRSNIDSRFIVPSPFFDLVLDNQGMLSVVNPGKHTIHQFTTDGAAHSTWGKAGNALEAFCGCCNPTHIAAMPDGSFVTSEKGLVRLKVYSPQGKMLTVVAAPAQFDDMTTGIDLAVDSKGRILALDPKAGRVRVFIKKSKED